MLETMGNPDKKYGFLLESKTIVPEDYKIFDKNKGPNTGGMGCICPNKYVSDAVFEDFKKNIMLPTLEGLKKEKLTYSGFLFFGVMITKKGCKLLEYNVFKWYFDNS